MIKLIELLDDMKESLPDLYYSVHFGTYTEVVLRYSNKKKVFVVQDKDSEAYIKEVIYDWYKEKRNETKERE